jgi:D-xylose transport system permease protein
MNTRGKMLGALVGSRSIRTTCVLLLLWAVLSLHPDTRAAFVTPGNLSNITAQVAEIVILGVGMTFVILIEGIDLSVGAGMAMFGVLAAWLQIDQGQPAIIAILAALALSVGIGLWHGLLVTRFAVPPFIATLSGLMAYRGIALVISGARGLSPMRSDFAVLAKRLPPAVSIALCALACVVGASMVAARERRRRRLGLKATSTIVTTTQLASIVVTASLAALVYQDGMPGPVLIAACAVAIGAFLLRKTRLGRYGFAIGGNPEAARLTGVPVARVKVLIYLMAGVLTAVAGLVSAARTNGVTPGNMGTLRELHVITAVVIGGTSLSGGRATMLGTVLGALIFGTLSNGMNLLNVNSNWQLILTGMILLGASMLDSLSSRKGTT